MHMHMHTYLLQYLYEYNILSIRCEVWSICLINSTFSLGLILKTGNLNLIRTMSLSKQIPPVRGSSIFRLQEVSVTRISVTFIFFLLVRIELIQADEKIAVLILVLEGALLERDQVLCACAVVVVLAVLRDFGLSFL